MALGLPSINIAFKQQAITAIKRGATGKVALILEEGGGTVLASEKKVKNNVLSLAGLKGAHTLYDINDMPEGLSEDNKKFVQLAFLGYTHAPTKVELFVLEKGVDTINTALTYFESTDFDYLVAPTIAEQATMESWIKTLRDSYGIKAKVVLTGTVTGDHEGIVHVDDFLVTSEGQLTLEQSAVRVAGLLAGTDLSISATYAPINEAIDIKPRTKQETIQAIGEGKLVFFKEAGKVKIARAVNSLTTLTQNKGTAFQKIKVVDIMDMISNDIRRTVRDNYIGKYANSYDNKVLLITAIGGYLDTLVNDGLIEKGYEVGIDIEAQKAYLKSIGVNVNMLNEQEIKEHNTGDKVFLSIKASILDAIEEININVIL